MRLITSMSKAVVTGIPVPSLRGDGDKIGDQYSAPALNSGLNTNSMKS